MGVCVLENVYACERACLSERKCMCKGETVCVESEMVYVCRRGGRDEGYMYRQWSVGACGCLYMCRGRGSEETVQVPVQSILQWCNSIGI